MVACFGTSRLHRSGRMATVSLWISALLVLLLSVDVCAQDRGLLKKERARFAGDRGDVYAVVVGISDYAHRGIRDLNYADDDAKAFVEFLRSERGGRVPVDNIHLLVDEQATFLNVRSELLDWLPVQANKRDHTAIVFFAGHGVLHLGDPLFLAQDTDPSKLGGSGLRMEVVQRAFDKLEAERKLFFADACHSGAIISPQARARSFSGNLLVDRLAGKGRAVITSSRDDENSYESDVLNAGYFTHFLLKGLNGAADGDSDGYVTLTETYDYIYNGVADAASDQGLLQHPRMKSEIDGVILLAKVGPTLKELEDASSAYQAAIEKLKQQIAEEEARLAREQAVRREKDAYDRAVRAGTIQALEDFLGKYPHSAYAVTARNRIEQLRLEAERKAFEDAKRVNTVKALEIFLKQYPRSSYVRDARSLIQKIQEREAEARKRAEEQARLELERKAREAAELKQTLKALQEQGEHPSEEDIVVALPGGATMDMVWIAPGTFRMGSPSSESGRDNNEGQHSVTLTKGFWLGKYEVTQRQWEAVMGTKPWSGKSYAKSSPNHAVSYVSWNDAQAFVSKLNQSSGTNAYRLPTEAEWEYACRAGTTTRYSFGDSEGQLGQYAWYDGNADAVGEDYAHAVGQKRHNPWSLYDMHGNVWEWCQDWYGSYSSGAQTDPQGPSSGAGRGLRGGCWGDDASYLRCALRDHFSPDDRDCYFGFRLCKNAP